MSRVVCRLPRAGLGNQLFPLMRAYVFAYLHNLPITVIGYHQIKLGPYLRREKTKRSYREYFTFQKGVIGELFDKVKVSLNRRQQIINDPKLTHQPTGPDKIYLFSAIPHWSDYFQDLREHRELVIRIFWDLLNEKVRKQIAKIEPPVVGLHVRKGDFRQLMPGEDFSKVGLVRTPEEYFAEIVENIRRIYGNDIPVSVFSDGYKHDFEKLFSLKNISLIEGNTDIVDMLLLSRSRVIIASAGSTFSYWAGFLSDAPLIMHPDHIHQPVRTRESGQLYEGPFDSSNKLLQDTIRDLTHPVKIYA